MEPAAVSERAERADLCAFVVDHAGHGGGADERRDEEEENGEEPRELFDDGGVAFKRDVAGV